MKPSLPQLLSVLSCDQRLEQARAFAQQHRLDFYPDSDKPDQIVTPYLLSYQERGVFILQSGKGAPGPISASFLNGKNAHRRQFGGGKGQLIAKAVGLKAGIIPVVLDATAGLGRDAFVLASLGCKVTMIEQSPVVSELLRHALEEARESDISEIAGRMELLSEDAVAWMTAQIEKPADVIYLDPMYPHRDKSALVKKEMRAFHDLVGPGLGEDRLLAIALERARYRVVVKRPRKGVMIAGQRPSFQLTGKSCRYDIYALKSLDALKQNASC